MQIVAGDHSKKSDVLFITVPQRTSAGPKKRTTVPNFAFFPKSRPPPKRHLRFVPRWIHWANKRHIWQRPEGAVQALFPRAHPRSPALEVVRMR